MKIDKLNPGPNCFDHEIYFFLPEKKGKEVFWVGDFNHWRTETRIKYSKKFGGYVFKLPASPFGVYFYKWVVDGQWILDPHNSSSFTNGTMGTNSMIRMKAYREPFEIYHRKHIDQGSLKRYEVKTPSLKEAREVYLYTPPRFDQNKKYPLLVLQDGRECVDLFPLPTLFDNLIHKRLTLPFLCLLVSPKPGARDNDYIYNAKFEKFLGLELLDWTRTEGIPISENRHERAILGFSLGGLVSVRTSIFYQDSYGLAGGESSAFWPKEFKIFDEIVQKAPLRTNYYLGCANMDGGEQMTALMASLLSRLGIQYQSRISVGGHEWYYWKTHMRHSLQYFFPQVNP